jgi:hypothetical protein
MRRPQPQFDIGRLTNTVHGRFLHRLAVERERRGLSR